ncbi:uncharacterized protein L203_106440 [Cryptococcus depauperatus CBS 7841]|uniref:Uncharacterized protein n=1 Tax=Cryptococcus depauperatus CBS 7841 TaxID=1295531 RepID=A0A1E3IIY0_9TREE|nr:hypothetical protein L203_02557 [Cryptococcus depauperatus CBS 7841]
MFAALSVLALVGGAAASSNSFWVVQHGKPLFTSRLDPIISPGGISGHVHSVIGGSAFNPTYTYEHSIAGKSTTANVNVDHSNYWVPQLYRKKGNGFELVKMNGANTYYLMRRSGDDEKVYAFPKGFRMLAGDPSRTTYNKSDYTNAAISYACLGAGRLPETGAFPERNCPSGLRAQVFFPNCWDGVNTWLPGSKHVAYPASGGHDSGGPCPATHPKRIMSLFYEFFYDDHFNYTPGARVWATGDNSGYSFHGDFTNGWPEGYFDEIFGYGDTCNVGFSVEKCPPLNKYFVKNGNKATPDSDAVIVDEDVGATGSILNKLPGNNPEWGSNGKKQPDPSYTETKKLISLANGDVVATSTTPSISTGSSTTSGKETDATHSTTSGGASKSSSQAGSSTATTTPDNLAVIVTGTSTGATTPVSSTTASTGNGRPKVCGTKRR